MAYYAALFENRHGARLFAEGRQGAEQRQYQTHLSAYEQAKNAAEMPMFNEPIAKLEAEITKLVQPVDVTYELKPE